MEMMVSGRVMMARIIHSDFSSHELYVGEIEADKLPKLENVDGYTKFYVVRNRDIEGSTFMYLGKGLKDAPNEIVAWYAKTGAFWHGYGKTFKEAIEGAQRDGWLYA